MVGILHLSLSAPKSASRKYKNFDVATLPTICLYLNYFAMSEILRSPIKHAVNATKTLSLPVVSLLAFFAQGVNSVTESEPPNTDPLPACRLNYIPPTTSEDLPEFLEKISLELMILDGLIAEQTQVSRRLEGEIFLGSITESDCRAHHDQIADSMLQSLSNLTCVLADAENIPLDQVVLDAINDRMTETHRLLDQIESQSGSCWTGRLLFNRGQREIERLRLQRIERDRDRDHYIPVINSRYTVTI